MKSQSDRLGPSCPRGPRGAPHTIHHIISTADTIDGSIERLFWEPAFIIVTLALALLAAMLLCLAPFQDGMIRLGGLVKGVPLNADVWRTRFDAWGLALASSPAVILLAVHAVRAIVFSREKEAFDRVFLGIAYLAWLLFVGYTALRHEPWMDELFVYVKARDMNLRGLLADVRVDGNFALWSILVSPFAKAGCPVWIITCLSLAMSAALVLIVLVRSPFSVYAKAAFAFTTPVAYFYPVVARPYAIFALLTILLAALWKRRQEHPVLTGSIIALLAHTHLYAEGFAGILILFILISDIIRPWKGLGRQERRWRLAGLAVACLGMLAAAALVLPALWTSDVVAASAGRMDLNLKAFFSNWIWEDPSKAGIPVIVCLTCLLIQLFFRNRGMLVLFSASFAYMLLFHIFIYTAGIPNRGSMWLFLLIFAFWNAPATRQATAPDAAPANGRQHKLLLLFLIIAINPAWNLRDWEQEYSGEKQLHKYISANISREAPLYITGSSVLSAYDGQRDLRLIAPLSVTGPELDNRLEEIFSQTKAESVFLILSKAKIAGFPYPLVHRWEQLYESPEIMAQLFQYSLLRVYPEN